MLRVVDHPFAPLPAEADRVADHGQVLLARGAGHLLEVKRPGLADERADGRERGHQLGQRRVGLGGQVTSARHAEGADLGVLELDVREQTKQLGLLGVRARKAGLDEMDAKTVERLDHANLLGCRERHALALHSVAERGVVEVYLGHWMPFCREGSSEVWARQRPRGHGGSTPRRR